MPMEDTSGIQSRIGSIIVVERWYCCRGSPVFSDRNIHRLAHPMEIGAEKTAAWQNYFLSRGLKQLFAQM